MRPQRFALRGVITSVGFQSGDRLVVGAWPTSPIGPLYDVMWARPDGTRVLVASDQNAADFIGAIYDFDEVRLVEVAVKMGRHSLDVWAGPIMLSVAAGRAIPLPFGPLRRPWFAKRIERPVAEALLGVTTWGVTSRGVRQWYMADQVRIIRYAAASIDGRDLGAFGPVDPPVGVGITEPPKIPTMVKVRPLLFDPAGRLDAAVEAAKTHP